MNKTFLKKTATMALLLGSSLLLNGCVCDFTAYGYAESPTPVSGEPPDLETLDKNLKKQAEEDAERKFPILKANAEANCQKSTPPGKVIWGDSCDQRPPAKCDGKLRYIATVKFTGEIFCTFFTNDVPKGSKVEGPFSFSEQTATGECETGVNPEDDAEAEQNKNCAISNAEGRGIQSVIINFGWVCDLAPKPENYAGNYIIAVRPAAVTASDEDTMNLRVCTATYPCGGICYPL